MRNGLKLNRDKILRLIAHLDEALGELEAISHLDRAKVIATRDRFAMEQLFYRVAMICIDLCYHLISRSSGTVPETYRGCFAEMVTKGMIPEELGKELENLAGLRNIIAHAYIPVDYGRLYDYLNCLGQIKKFREIVLDMARI